MTATLPVIKWKLRSVMADRRMTATKLADLLEVNRVTVSGWVGSDEIPAFRNPTETLNQLCKYLDCVPSDLIAYTPDEEGASDRPSTSTPSPAPEPPAKASRRSGTRRAAKDPSGAAQFGVGDCVRLPSGDRAYIESVEGDYAYFTWEVSKVKDFGPMHLFELVHKAA